ncbi:hypothetical protein OCK02_25025 [Rhizobium sp. TRM96647]|uniref:hypothetical protein n=1 Tax=unclassified Rhizobium TaxID=2613769 RepID=UPI0021E75201|nr:MULTISPECIES: hypothetical protein [unclassified Rhizobium]MCV3739417.1 hypothetical protein [Rhizobium sp. TRM96647]MCV3761083.1 hypothetical protein [Rhizobium sp. TRM96650]
MNIANIYKSCLVALFSVAIALPANADEKDTNKQIDELLGDHTKYKVVIIELQRAVAAHDAAGVAKLISYPIGVKVKGKETVIKSAKAFEEHYEGILTPAITKAFVNQKYGDLFVNYQGIMFGDGQVWVSGICHDNACKSFEAKVTTIQEGPQ